MFTNELQTMERKLDEFRSKTLSPKEYNTVVGLSKLKYTYQDVADEFGPVEKNLEMKFFRPTHITAEDRKRMRGGVI